MWVKVDYSTEAKKNPKPNMPGEWAIYTKRHWWNYGWYSYKVMCEKYPDAVCCVLRELGL